MSEEIKELLFLLHNDRLTEAGKRKLEQEIERLNQYVDFYNDLDDKQNKELQNLKQINEEHQKLNGELRVENDRLNNIINELEKRCNEMLKLYDTFNDEQRFNNWKEYKVYGTILDWIEELKGSNKE